MKPTIEEENEYQSIGLNKVVFPFVILLTFYIFSVFLFLMEMIHYNKNRKSIHFIN